MPRIFPALFASLIAFAAAGSAAAAQNAEQNTAAVVASPRVLPPPSQAQRTVQTAQIRQKAQAGELRIHPNAINAVYGGLLDGEASLFFRSGDIYYEAKDWLDPADSNFKRTFYWDVKNAPKATGAVWQVSTRPFAPMLSISANPMEPEGLVRSGATFAQAGSFTIDFAELAVEQGWREKPKTATLQRSPTVARTGRIAPVVPNTQPGAAPPSRLKKKDTPTTVQRKSPRTMGTTTLGLADNNILTLISRGGTATFYVRVLPVIGDAQSPKIIGFPSPIGEIKYGERPPPESPFKGFEWREKEIPHLTVTAFSYTPFWFDNRWPKGCKVFKGGTDYWNPLEFLLDAWDWAAGAYADIKSFVVDIAAGLLPIIPREAFEYALDAALASAGIPPTLPNIDQMMEEGAGYLAEQAAADIAGPVGGALTNELAGELFEDAAASMIAEMTAEELSDAVQDQLKKELQSEIEKSAQSARAEIEGKAEDMYCQTREYVPTIRLTVKNMTNKRYKDVPVAIGDEVGIFKTKTPTITIGPNESYDLVFPMYPDLWKTAWRNNVSLYDAHDEYWSDYYETPTRFFVTGPDTVACYESEYGFVMQCIAAPPGDPRPLRFTSPTPQALSDGYAL